jgi:protein SMG6
MPFLCITVVTELDGLAKQFSATGQAATAALRYLESNIRASTRNLKVQTSKGNYLTQLFIRSEIMDSPLNEIQDREATMDDFILRVASFQADHFVDRSNLLGQVSDTEFTLQKHKASKVLFFTFDRNLRLRAKARGIQTATEKDLIRIAGEELRSEADTGYDQPNAILV